MKQLHDRNFDMRSDFYDESVIKNLMKKLKAIIRKLKGKVTDEESYIFDELLEYFGGYLKDGYFVSCEDYIAGCNIYIENTLFTLYYNFIPLWRFTSYDQCLLCNWPEIKQDFCLIPVDNDPEKVKKLYSKIKEYYPKFDTEVYSTTSYEGF